MYNPMFASDSAEAVVINPNFFYNLDYCELIDIQPPLKHLYTIHIFSVLTFGILSKYRLHITGWHVLD